MQEILEQIRSVVRGIWLKKRYIVMLSWLVALAGWAAITTMPDKYSASARVYVDTQSLLKPLLRGMTISNNPDEQVRLMVKTLLSRPNLEKILRMVDLDILANNQSEFDSLIEQLSSNIKLARTTKDNLYTITYAGNNPVKSTQIVQAVLKVFVDNTVGQSRDETLIAKQFFTEQIAEYEKRLADAEQRVTLFRQQNGSLISNSGNGYYANLTNLESTLDATQLEQRQLEYQLLAARQKLAGERPTFGLLTQSQKLQYNTSFDQRISSMQDSLDKLTLRYTTEHPDVRQASSRIEHLKALRDQEILEMIEVAASSNNSSIHSLDSNPVFQEMRIKVLDIENRLVGIKVRVSDLVAKVDALRSKIHLIPEIESQLTALNRGYNVTKQKYEELLKRRETARLGEQADQSVDEIQFRVIDPPRAQEKPTGPPRALYYTLVLFAGLGIGIATAFVMSQLQTVIMSPYQLTQLTGLPVLGTVSNINEGQYGQNQRTKNAVFFSLVGLLVTVYFIIIALEISDSLLPQVRNLAQGFLQ